MHWLEQLFVGSETVTVAHAVLVLSIVAAIGIGIGSLKFRGVGLGIAGVLFSGLAFGHFAISIDDHIMEFVREFGLILFVYTIGAQVGPGFFASLRKQGLSLNLMAAAIVILGALVTVLIVLWGGLQLPVAVGLFAGATTNTPSLAAAQEAIKSLKLGDEVSRLPGLGYAVAYPFGIIGTILTMIAARLVFRINPAKEAETLTLLQDKRPALQTMNIEVNNANLEGLALQNVPMLDASGVVVSRVMHQGKAHMARPETILHAGDILHAVGPRDQLEQFRLIVGTESKVNLAAMPSNISVRRILVTRSAALGKTIDELDLVERFGITVTRVSRAEIELPPLNVRLQFGDTLIVVGEGESIRRVATELGDSIRQLNYPQIIPVFVGIALGVILGSLPIYVPGISGPVKLGLAGGPLIVAILLSRLGNIGPVVWYMPASANFILREVGIVLFLACVGLKSGGGLVSTLQQGAGMQWILAGSLITLVPLLLVALAARLFYRINYLTLCGMIAGSMTDPPALAFASSVTGSDAPSISYATVYPLVMLLRVLIAQALVLLLAG